jgi:hypothetical protein
MKPSAPLAFFSTVLAVAVPAAAQEASRASIVTAGLTAGAMRFKGGFTEDVLTGVLQVQPHPWLTLGVAPTAARVAPPDSTAYSGFGDLPLSLGLTRQFPGRASPAVGAAVEVTLPTGTTTGGIGSRDPGWAADVGAGFAPRPGSYLFFNAGQSLTPARLGFPRSVESTSVGADGSFKLSDRLTATASLAADVARSDTLAPLTRTAGAGLGFGLGGAARLMVDGSVGLNDQSPQWQLSIGLGTAFSGLSPVGLGNPFERVKKAFGQSTIKVGGSKGRGRAP